jgi:hypothetical protein
MKTKDLLQTLQELEVELLTPSARKSDRVAQLLADGFVEYSSSGRIYDKAEVIFALACESAAEITASEFSVQLIASNAALLRYVSCRHAVNKVYALRSSVWQFQNEQWRMMFHQGTPCPGGSPPKF